MDLDYTANHVDVSHEINSALAIVSLSSQRVAKEIEIRNDVIRIAYKSGASLRQLSEVSGLGRKAIMTIITKANDG